MKTIPLSDLLNRITPLPWKSVPGFINEQGVNNDKYATHAANVLPGLVEAAKPFCHPDLSRLQGGNSQGDESPIFQRNGAMLKISDVKRLQAALASAEKVKVEG